LFGNQALLGLINTRPDLLQQGVQTSAPQTPQTTTTPTVDELLAQGSADPSGLMIPMEDMVPPMLPPYSQLTDEELTALVPLAMFSQGYDPSVLNTPEGALLQERFLRNLRLQSNLSALDAYGRLLETQKALDDRVNAFFGDIAEDMSVAFSQQNLQMVVGEIIKNWKTRNPNRSWNRLAPNVRMNEIRTLLRTPEAFPSLSHLYQRWRNIKTRLEQRKAMLPIQDRERVSYLERELGNTFEDFIMKYLILDDPEEAELERYNRLMSYMAAQQGALGLEGLPSVGGLPSVSAPSFGLPSLGGGSYGSGGAPQQQPQEHPFRAVEDKFNDLLRQSHTIKNKVVQLNAPPASIGLGSLHLMGDYQQMRNFILSSGVLSGRTPAETRQYANTVFRILDRANTLSDIQAEANRYLQSHKDEDQEIGRRLWNVYLLLQTAYIAQENGVNISASNRRFWSAVIPRIIRHTSHIQKTQTLYGDRIRRQGNQGQFRSGDEAVADIYEMTQQSPQEILQTIGGRTVAIVNADQTTIRDLQNRGFKAALNLQLDAPLYREVLKIANQASGSFGQGRTEKVAQLSRQLIGLLTAQYPNLINQLSVMLTQMEKQGERQKLFGNRKVIFALTPKPGNKGILTVYMTDPVYPQQRRTQGRTQRGGGH